MWARHVRCAYPTLSLLVRRWLPIKKSIENSAAVSDRVWETDSVAGVNGASGELLLHI